MSAETERPYVLIKRGYFWRPQDMGYTANIAEAGRYTRAEAEERVHGGAQPVTMHLASEFEKVDPAAELASLRQQLDEANERADRAETALQEQFRLYCDETKKHNATSALLAKAKEDFDYAAQALTEHAEAVGVSPDHINYIDETTKAIISAWANKTSLEQTNAALKAEVERLTKEVAHQKAAREDEEIWWNRKHDQTEALTAARALNDRLAGALDKYTDQTCASDELATEACAALDAYAKSKEAAK